MADPEPTDAAVRRIKQRAEMRSTRKLVENAEKKAAKKSAAGYKKSLAKRKANIAARLEEEAYAAARMDLIEGKTQAQICEVLGKNVRWISSTRQNHPQIFLEAYRRVVREIEEQRALAALRGHSTLAKLERAASAAIEDAFNSPTVSKVSKAKLGLQIYDRIGVGSASSSQQASAPPPPNAKAEVAAALSGEDAAHVEKIEDAEFEEVDQPDEEVEEDDDA